MNPFEFTEDLAEVAEVMCSSSYQQMFEKVFNERTRALSPEEQQVLVDYPNKFVRYHGERRQEIVDQFRHAHFQWFNRWLEKEHCNQLPYAKWNKRMAHIMLHLKNSLFRLDRGDVITDKNILRTCRKIVDTATDILSCVIQENTMDPTAHILVQELLLILFYFTLDTDLALYLKHRQLIPLMKLLIQTSGDDNEIHLNAYRILAVVMAESDIKELEDSPRIVSVFLACIKVSIDGGFRTEDRLHNALRSLRSKSYGANVVAPIPEKRRVTIASKQLYSFDSSDFHANSSQLSNSMLLNMNTENARSLKRSSECGEGFLLSISMDKRCCDLLFLALTQHDQIREELIKQKGDLFFLRCVLENKFNPVKAKFPALEILLALTSEEEFLTSLKANTDFIKNIQTSGATAEQSLELVITALLWKLKKLAPPVTEIDEDQASKSSTMVNLKKKYEIMLSYSHSDKEVCHSVCEKLEKDGFCLD